MGLDVHSMKDAAIQEVFKDRKFEIIERGGKIVTIYPKLISH